MTAAALAAAGLALAPPRLARPYAPPPVADARSWTGQVTALVATGARLCVSARSTAELATTAANAGARTAPAPALRIPGLAAPVWLLGPRGEVTVTATQGRDGFRCTVLATAGEAGWLQRALPSLAQSLGFARTPTIAARWPGEAAYRGRSGPGAGAYLATAAPFVHGAPYGALLVIARPSR